MADERQFISHYLGWVEYCLLRTFHQRHEGTDGHAGRPFCLMRADGIAPRGAGYVEMCPFGLVDEFLDEHRAHNGAGLASRADVLNVRDVRLDLFAVFLAHRELPETFACLLAESDDPVDELLIVAHHARILIAEGDNHRTGQGCHVNNRSSALFLGISDSISQNKTSFRVGVEDLDSLAVGSGDDIAGPRS